MCTCMVKMDVFKFKLIHSFFWCTKYEQYPFIWEAGVRKYVDISLVNVLKWQINVTAVSRMAKLLLCDLFRSFLIFLISKHLKLQIIYCYLRALWDIWDYLLLFSLTSGTHFILARLSSLFWLQTCDRRDEQWGKKWQQTHTHTHKLWGCGDVSQHFKKYSGGLFFSAADIVAQLGCIFKLLTCC